MIGFMIMAVICLACLFFIVSLLSLMTWVVVKMLRALFPDRFVSVKRKRDEK